jgi:zinc and cadmium transporter
MLLAFFLTALAVCGIVLGVGLGESRGLSPRIAAAGGGLLFGISLFWVLPEMAGQSGWIVGGLALLAGALPLWLIDRFMHPICPSCAVSHDHSHCAEPPLHGFALPLLIAAGAHSLLDGWSVRLLASHGIAGWAVPLGLALHKVPEGIALGLIVRESVVSGRRAFFACVAAECFTLLGALLEPIADQAGVIRFGGGWVTGVLAVTGGSFLFLGFHTVHGSRKRPGVVPAFLATLCGISSMAVAHRRFGAL